ncbi:MAG: decarboxylating 6-phosphogluconate dehydrogenase [Burkholderiales bacterium]|nr:MAG: decarboxylating 6-phosphogluconate dehydrogenase [Burkholderiales bacterium]
MTSPLNFAIIGLGKMGGNMARRWSRAGRSLAIFDQDSAVTQDLAAETNCRAASSPEAALQSLAADQPRILWLMLPSGKITEDTIERLRPLLRKGDLLVDGANSNYKDSVRRGAALASQGILFADVGVSGGVHGLANGYCLMAGASDEAIALLKPWLQALAPKDDTGWLHAGPVGAGHYVKMVHNGIEYGMMQAFAEGFALLGAKKEFDLDLAAVGELWRHGSVVRSWLLDLTAAALKEDSKLEGIQPYVSDSGEGRWTAIEGVELGIPTPVMTTALMARFASQGSADFGSKVLAKMRQGFGGHAVKSV